MLAIESGYIGYTLQQYITKAKAGVRRPTEAFEKILTQVPGQIESSLGSFFLPGLTIEDAKLGDLPNMYSLIPLAQSVNAPIRALSSRTAWWAHSLSSRKIMPRSYIARRSLAKNVGKPLEHSCDCLARFTCDRIGRKTMCHLHGAGASAGSYSTIVQGSPPDWRSFLLGMADLLPQVMTGHRHIP
jgi:hypothetical protein